MKRTVVICIKSKSNQLLIKALECLGQPKNQLEGVVGGVKLNDTDLVNYDGLSSKKQSHR